LYVPVFDGLYGRAYQQERDPELQQFLASAIGVHPELTVRLIHGTVDQTIPMENSVEFEAALADAGYDVELTTFDGGHQTPPPERSLEVFKEVLGL
jgi:predicted esterase